MSEHNKLPCKVHPAAELFPMMDAEAFAALKADIQQHGQREWCDFYKGELLDGRNRWRACEQLGIEPLSCELDETDGFDPVAYVLSKNLHRRHLTESQRAMVAAGASAQYASDAEARMKAGKTADPTAPVQQGTAAKKAAEMMGVSERLVYQAKAVERDGAPEVAAAVRDGNITVAQAGRLVKAVANKKTQAKVIAETSRLNPRLRVSVLTKRIATAERRRESRAKKDERPAEPPSPATDDDDFRLRQLAGSVNAFIYRFESLADALLSSDPACVKWTDEDAELLTEVRSRLTALSDRVDKVVAFVTEGAA